MNGLHRGFVEDVADPENRQRVRVRIPPLHGDAPTAALPWATRMFDNAGNQHGVFFPLQPSTSPNRNDGDGVFVMFENDDELLPVIVGCWRRTADVMPETLPNNKRRHIEKTRHGSTIEFGEDQQDFEFKVTMPSGHVLHMRESAGGCGIHLTTAGGQVFSLQDEHPGQAQGVTLNDYDNRPTLWYTDANVAAPLTTPAPGAADGVVASSTPGVATGFGEKGILLKSSAGHSFSIKDVNDGIEVKSATGHSIKISPLLNSIDVQTFGGNTAKFQDGVGVIMTSEFGQALSMTALDFGMSWPSLNMYLHFGGSENRWKIVGDLKIDCTGDFEILAGGDILLQAAGTLTEQGASRIEIPPVGP